MDKLCTQNFRYITEEWTIYHKQPLPQHPHQGTFPLKCTLEKVDNFRAWSMESQLLKLFVLSLSEWSSVMKLEPKPIPAPSRWSRGIERSVQTEKDLSRKLLGSITTLGLISRLRSPLLCFLCFFDPAEMRNIWWSSEINKYINSIWSDEYLNFCKIPLTVREIWISDL